mgnify:CR=1 FL=1
MLVRELVALLQDLDQDMEVEMAMNMEYQSPICSDFVETAYREDGTQYVLITDCPQDYYDQVWDERYQAGEDFADGSDAKKATVT